MKKKKMRTKMTIPEISLNMQDFFSRKVAYTIYDVSSEVF
jgi:hypothetical protein